MDPNIEDDEDETRDVLAQGFWVDDHTSSEGSFRDSKMSKESGESFTNTSQSQSGQSQGSKGSLEDYKLGGSKFHLR